MSTNFYEKFLRAFQKGTHWMMVSMMMKAYAIDQSYLTNKPKGLIARIASIWVRVNIPNPRN